MIQALRDLTGLDRFDHPPGRELGQEEWPLQIRVEDQVPTFLRRFEQVAAALGRDPGVVDQHVQTSEPFADLLDQRGSIRRQPHVAAHRDRLSAASFDLRNHGSRGLRAAEVIDPTA